MIDAACARIDGDALRANLRRLREAAGGARMMAVVKANAYGHGLVATARALDKADSFAVARLEEGIALREAGIGRPIVLLEGALGAGALRAAAGHGFEIVVHEPTQLDALAALEPGLSLTVWLKVDTGMHRLGFSPEEAPAALERLRDLTAVAELRLMTHLASADERDNPRTGEQLQRLAAIGAGFGGALSIANSPGLLAWPASLASGDGESWARPGIALYGISPFEDATGAALGLAPAMRLLAPVIAVKTVPAGGRIGYGGRFRATRETRIAVIAAGYGDGYPRSLPDGTPVLVNGRRARLAGRVSMDMITVDVGAAGGIAPGDPALLWGPELPVEEIAGYAGTIAYELVTRVSARVRREWSDDESDDASRDGSDQNPERAAGDRGAATGRFRS